MRADLIVPAALLVAGLAGGYVAGRSGIGRRRAPVLVMQHVELDDAVARHPSSAPLEDPRR